MASAAFGVLRCEEACTTSADCDDPGQFCVNGQCVENYCDGQLACDLFAGRDAPPDAGDGTCLHLPPFDDTVCRVERHGQAILRPAGEPRRIPLEICPKDFACARELHFGGFSCERACDASGQGCPRGEYCDTDFLLCFSAGDSGPRCLPGAMPNDGGACQFGECTVPSDAGDYQVSDDIVCGAGDPCVCPEECLLSEAKEYFLCEQACQTDSDCDDPGQICSAGQCVDNDCNGTALLCDLDGVSSDGGQGTCLPADYGLDMMACTSPGTASGACTPGSSRSQSASESCPLGFACVPVSDGGLECLPACVVNGDCAQGQTCVDSIELGVSLCLPLNDAGTCAVGQSTPPASAVCGDIIGAQNTVCGCGYGCVGELCEQICQQDSDCLVASDICVGTVAQSYCVPGG